ncbi:unnamed protein product [Ilex paraguariensis]|uniref:Uncharacterized protein n=1 Tax=Ilex paraguariensis TaxID=185542 RepID=A0ABC8UW52_9AQUA
MRGAPLSITVSMSSPMKFKIPEDSVSDISQMAGPSEASPMDRQTTSQLTLSERREGWLIETRKRLNGRFDKPLGSEVSLNVSLKRKTETSSFDGCSTILKGNNFSASSSSSKQPMKTIAELLACAYDNLLNFFSAKKDTKSSIPEIICEEQDDQIIQNMIEELLDEGNNFSLIDEEPMAPQENKEEDAQVKEEGKVVKGFMRSF